MIGPDWIRKRDRGKTGCLGYMDVNFIQVAEWQHNGRRVCENIPKC